MKREEIINCHCGFREEDGLMVQCELCLCWQHALCHNIQREAEACSLLT
jgi:PHD finger protein 20